MPKKQNQAKRSDLVKSSAKDLLAGYEDFLLELKTRIRSAQIKAALAANSEMISLYWEIGRGIVERQEKAGWGDEVVDRLSRDLMYEFSATKGFSRANLFRMRAFYLAYRSQPEFVAQVVRQIPWGQNLVLIEKVKAQAEREWYARQTVENGWSRAVLIHQIELGLYERQARAEKAHNFARTLPPFDSDLVAQTLKDEYIFDFLSLGAAHKERDLELGLVNRIRDFLLELGRGFAFLGSQYHLEVGGQDFYVDLLFYHIYLRRMIVIDLKMKDFEPADAGQMNFYLAAIDDLVKAPEDKPSVGIILCKGKNQAVAEYALRDMGKPMGVASYKLRRELPAELAEALPAPDELERLINQAEGGILTGAGFRGRGPSK
ncbi:MAG TPA: PDDEXK nuclease domain-containing protein [Blastocatellia bacterium]|nr:PDDEXK nuclease domain-containing protein [Blastocatellia bacterium]